MKNNFDINSDSEEECPICYELILHNGYVVTQCNHKYCSICYAKHIRKKEDCPLCRKKIAPEIDAKELSPEKALQLVHLEILDNPNYVFDLEEVFKNETETENENETENDNDNEQKNNKIMDEILKILSEFGLGVSKRCKNWYLTNE
jgi:hypothetical protein